MMSIPAQRQDHKRCNCPYYVYNGWTKLPIAVIMVDDVALYDKLDEYIPKLVHNYKFAMCDTVPDQFAYLKQELKSQYDIDTLIRPIRGTII